MYILLILFVTFLIIFIYSSLVIAKRSDESSIKYKKYKIK